MEARVEEPGFGVEPVLLLTAEEKLGAALEECIGVDCKTERTGDESSVQVDLEARGARDLEADTLPEASFEALSRLLVPAPSPTGRSSLPTRRRAGSP